PRRVRGAEAFQLAARELRGTEEVHVERRFPGLHALDRKILAEQALLRRLVAKQEERRGAREPSLEPIVEDLDSGLRARSGGARRRDLEEVRDRLGGVMEEERGHGVEVDADRRPEFLGRLAHRHPDSLEVAEARDEKRLLAGR